MISACRLASGSSSSGSQTLHAMPMRSASEASTHCDDSSIHAAFWRPINCGSRYDDAASGATPRLVNGHFSRAVEDMKTRSAYPRTVVPMPTPTPLTAHTNGLVRSVSALIIVVKWLPWSLICGSVIRACISLRSLPALNARPAPVSRTTATSGSASASRSAVAVAR